MNIKREIPFDIPIKEILLERGIITKAKELCSPKGKCHIICDENTKSFISIDCDKTILPANQKADLETALKISQIDCEHFVALGSGTINDITKYAAHKAGKTYSVFGTAPSMNGYASGNSSLLVDGHKKSFSASPPESIYLDTEILENAPKRLINAGIGDSICNSTVKNDNLLAHRAIGAEYYKNFFRLIEKHEEDIFHDIEALAKTLIYSGIAMLLAGNSAPASQAEHMIAHYMELMQPDAPQSYHGEQIAVTTITMAEIQNELISNPIIVNAMDIPEEQLRNHFGQKQAEEFIRQIKPFSHLESKNIELDGFKRIDIDKLRSQLESISAPTKPEDIGWDDDIYQDAIRMSKYTRDRFTFLNLVN